MKTQDTKISKKRVLILRTLMILTALLLVGYYVLNKYYFKPKRYKEKVFNEMKRYPNNAQYSDEKLKNCVDCLYDAFSKKYGDVSNFPEESEDAIIDIDYYKILIRCTADNLYDSIKREKVLNRIDSAANVLFLNDVKKGKVIPVN